MAKLAAELRAMSVTEVASIIGVSQPVFSKWRSQFPASFPDKDASGLLCVRDVLCWWIANKAPEAVAGPVWEKLLIRFGSKVVPEPEVDPERRPVGRPPGSVKVVEKSESDLEDEQVDRSLKWLKYRRELARVEKELDQLVSVDQVRDIMQELAKNLRAAQQQFQSRTGHEAGPVFESAFRKLEEDLSKLSDGGDGGDADEDG